MPSTLRITFSVAIFLFLPCLGYAQTRDDLVAAVDPDASSSESVEN